MNSCPFNLFLRYLPEPPSVPVRVPWFSRLRALECRRGGCSLPFLFPSCPSFFCACSFLKSPSQFPREALGSVVLLRAIETPVLGRCRCFPVQMRSVLRGSEAILEMDPDKAYPVMRERIESFYGPRFEDVCVEYITDVEMCEWFGKWRGRVAVREDGRTVKDSEGKTVTVDSDIDVVARVLRGGLRLVLMCECKFTRRRSGRLELEDLEEAVERARKGGENIEYILFSRSGFTSDLMDMAEARSDLRLVSMDEISEWAEGGAPSPE